MRFSDELKPENMARLFSKSRLIRTEVKTLIGLTMRAPIDFFLPSPQTISDSIEQSEALLNELHQAMMGDGAELFAEENLANPDFNPFRSGDVLREAIFYSGKSAYAFQYRDLAPLKYSADAVGYNGTRVSTWRSAARCAGTLLSS